MSLKSFHLFFIVASILLSAGFAGWCFNQYGYTREAWVLGSGIGSTLLTAVLLAYLPWFYRKYRELSYLAFAAMVGVGLMGSESAQACATCFGNPASPLVQSANAGIWFLMAVIGTVLVGFICLFGFWWNRARQLKSQETTRLAA